MPEDESMINDDNASDDSDSANSIELENEAKEIVEKLKKEPLNYDLHNRLVDAYYKLGELDLLRMAFKEWSSKFPLPPDRWLQHLKCEINASDDTDLEQRQSIQLLFDQGVEDYLSVELWAEYCQWIISDLDDNKTRAVMERASKACFMHVAKAGLIWDIYRLFEMAMLEAAEGDDIKIKAQKDRIEKLFRRQFAHGTMGIEETWAEYVEFHGNDESSIEDSVKEKYEASLLKLKELLILEDSLETCDDGSALETAYNKYIDQLIDKKEPQFRIICTFERAITDLPKSYNIWNRYLSWLFERVKHEAQLVLKAYKRATRNLPSVHTFWCGYLILLERTGATKEYIDDVWQHAYTTYIKPEHGVQLWLEYVGIVKRREDFENKEKEKSYSQTMQVWKWGVACMKTMLGIVSSGDVNESVEEAVAWDPQGDYRKFYAHFAAVKANDMTTANENWQELLRIGFGRNAFPWLEYIQLLRQCNQPADAIRKTFYRALNSTSDEPQRICDALLQYEREEGSYKDFETAIVKVMQKRKQVEIANVKKEEKIAKSKNSQSKLEDQQYNRKQRRQQERGELLHQKPPRQKEERFQNSATSLNDVSRKRVKEESWNDIEAPAFKQQRTKTEEHIKDTALKPTTSVMQQEVKLPEPSGVPLDTNTQKERTVFVSNLDFALDPKRLREFFANVGHIVEIRLIPRFGGEGTHKGYGYVEFETVKQAKQALQFDRELLDGRPVFVNVYKEKSETTAGGAKPRFKFAQDDVDMTKLFVRNIGTHVKQQDIKKVFDILPGFAAFRLVTNKSGQSKGIAYVQFDTETNAKSALEKTDLTMVEGRAISCAFSNPPAKDSGMPIRLQRKAVVSSTTHQKSRIVAPQSTGGFMAPRAVNIKAKTCPKNPVLGAGSKSIASVKNDQPISNTQLTNEQFRQQFLKKT